MHQRPATLEFLKMLGETIPPMRVANTMSRKQLIFLGNCTRFPDDQ